MRYGLTAGRITPAENLSLVKNTNSTKASSHLISQFLENGRNTILSKKATQIGIAVCTAKTRGKVMQKGDSLAVVVYASGYKANGRAKKEISKLVRRKGK